MRVPARSSSAAIVFWAAAGALAAVTAGNAAFQIFRPSAVSAVSVFSANDGDALNLRFNDAFVRTGGNLQDGGQWLDQARRVLSRNPLDAEMVRVAALSSAGSDADLGVMRARMMLSERVSARDLPTQLWLLEDMVGRGEVEGVLRHYDRAMSVHPKSQAQLYPILTQALGDRNIRVALAPYVRADRPWSYEFVGYAVDKADDPASVADLMALSGGSRSVPDNRPLETMMLNTLVAKDRADVARRYARMMVVPAKAQAIMSNFGFSDVTMDPDLRPFTWSMVEDLSIRTTFDPREGLTSVAGGGIGGVALDRVMFLRPGRWRLTQKVELPRLSPMMDAIWSATCLGWKDVTPFWTHAVPQQPGGQVDRSLIDIPAGCPAVRIRLTVRGADVQEDSTIAIRSVSLAPA